VRGMEIPSKRIQKKFCPFSKICALVFANMKNWRSDQVLSWRSENLYSTYET
jgi:hypothetical protein